MTKRVSWLYPNTRKQDHINGVIPFMSRASMFCPLAMRYATMDVWPNWAARWMEL